MRFKRVYIEITNTCNLTCSFCIQNHRVPKIMSVDEFSNILIQIRPYSDYIYLHVLGEPLSHPYLDEILTLCEQANMQVNITTNGTLLVQKTEVLMKHRIRQINVSLHSFPQHSHPHYFEDVFVSCEALATQGTYINYRLWSLEEQGLSKDSTHIIKNIVTQYSIDITQKDMKRLNRISLCSNISLHFEKVFTWPSLINPYVNDVGRCLGMKEMCAILSNGDVVPCCLDSKGDCVLGNLFHQPFEEIITTKKAQDIVEGFAQHKIKETLCQHCEYRLRFSK